MQAAFKNMIFSLDEIINGYHVHNDSLMDGRLGLAIYNFGMYKVFKEYKFKKRGIALIEEVTSNISSQKSSLLIHQSFSSGLPGYCFVVDLLSRKNQFIEVSHNLEEIHEYIFSEASRFIKENRYDPIHGGLGGLYYFTQLAHLEQTNKYIDVLTGLLYKKAIIKNEMFMFINADTTAYEKSESINFSFSHGLSGLLIILLRAYYKSHASKSKIREIIRKTVKYILSKENKIDFEKGRCNHFPSSYCESMAKQSKENVTRNLSRIAWCYGDLNIAYILYKAAIVLNDYSLIEKANIIGATSTRRKSEKETNVLNSHFCHGAAGVAQFYRTLFYLTGYELYSNAYKYWIERTLRHVKVDIRNNEFGERSASLIDGFPAVSLTLLDYQSKVRLEWDRSFFLNI